MEREDVNGILYMLHDGKSIFMVFISRKNKAKIDGSVLKWHVTCLFLAGLEKKVFCFDEQRHVWFANVFSVE